MPRKIKVIRIEHFGSNFTNNDSATLIATGLIHHLVMLH